MNPEPEVRMSPEPEVRMDERRWTEEQAVLFDMGTDGLPKLRRVAVTADAGAGKTSVLTERISRSIESSSTINQRRSPHS